MITNLKNILTKKEKEKRFREDKLKNFYNFKI